MCHQISSCIGVDGNLLQVLAVEVLAKGFSNLRVELDITGILCFPNPKQDVCIVQGHAESDLNEAGKKQAQAVKFVAQLLKEIPPRCAGGYCMNVAVYIFSFHTLVDFTELIRMAMAFRWLRS